MKLRAWAAWAVLLALALAAGLAAGPSQETDSPVPSVLNPGPRGAAVLRAWLEASGADVRLGKAPLTQLPPEVRTVIVIAPSARRIEDDEVAALEAFVQAGGTLLYFDPRAPQPSMDRWLHLKAGKAPPLDVDDRLADVGGATVDTLLAGGLAAGTRHFRVSAERMLEVDDPLAVEVASHGALWWKRLGRGEVWIGAGPDLAESARLELLDNAAFWQNVGGRGPLLFDEFHHDTAPPPPLTVNLLASLLQFALCAALFVLVRGSRLGPARPTPVRRHRSALEYVRAMASLTAGAKADAELVAGLRAEARRFLHERLGIAPALPLHEAAREVERLTGFPAARTLRLERESDFLALSQLVAELEAGALGRRS